MVSDKKCAVQTPQLLKNIRYRNTTSCSSKLFLNHLEKDWNRNPFIITRFEASTKVCIQRLVNCGEMLKFLCASWTMLLWWVIKLWKSLFHNKNNSANKYIKWNQSPCSGPSWDLPAQGDSAEAVLGVLVSSTWAWASSNLQQQWWPRASSVLY